MSATNATDLAKKRFWGCATLWGLILLISLYDHGAIWFCMEEKIHCGRGLRSRDTRLEAVCVNRGQPNIGISDKTLVVPLKYKWTSNLNFLQNWNYLSFGTKAEILLPPNLASVWPLQSKTLNLSCPNQRLRGQRWVGLRLDSVGCSLTRVFTRYWYNSRYHTSQDSARAFLLSSLLYSENRLPSPPLRTRG